LAGNDFFMVRCVRLFIQMYVCIDHLRVKILLSP
jgi:hypothetical protein